MNALLVLYAGQLQKEAFQPLFDGKNSFDLALQQSLKFPGVAKTVILGCEKFPEDTENCGSRLPPGVIVQTRSTWTKKSLLEELALQQQGFDLSYFVWADCPFLDPAMAAKLADRHVSYAAEYSYADGWPYGLAPELLSPATAAILAKILGEEDGPVERDMLFSVIQKDINEFDIETEISTVDLRCHRLNLCADSKRNLLLLHRFVEAAGIPDTAMVETIIAEQPEILRTLPNFYPIQVSSLCPQSCAICPYSAINGDEHSVRRDFMEADQFSRLLDKIVDFSGDAVIDLSLWGELSLHPLKMELIEMVLKKPALALVIETSGIGWKSEELEHCAELAKKAASTPERIQAMPPLSWIVSLDTTDPQKYKELRGAGFAEANDCAKKLLTLFPKDAYVQAVRFSGNEEDIEKFYRWWKDAAGAGNIIIQKYNDYCGFLPHKQASDISPVNRQPCWHLMRDMPILLDGTVTLCSGNFELAADILKNGADGNNHGERVMGNAFTASLDSIWERGKRFYTQHCEKKYEDGCQACDEYYTYNF